METSQKMPAEQIRTEKLKSTLLFLFIIFCICFIFSGWFAVLSSPQYAFATEKSNIRSIQYSINNQDLSRSSSVETLLKKPKSWLRGVSEITLKVENKLGALLLTISEEKIMNQKENKERYLPIYLNDVAFSRTEEFMENNYDHCVQEPLIDNENIEIGKIQVKKFDQGVKKIAFEFLIQLQEIRLPIHLTCFGNSPYHNQIIYVTLDSLSLDILHKSKVTYEWGSKGADTYRL